jgi:putative flippase GtrA
VPGLNAVRRVTARMPRSVVRFAAVGLLNTAIDLVLFAVLAAPLGILVANFVSTSAGMAFSFMMNGRHTFGAQRRTLGQAVLFVTSNAGTMWVLQPLLIHTAYDVAAVPLVVAKVVALCGSVVANFLFYRYVVWRPSSRPRGTSGPRREGGWSEPTAELAQP